MQWCNKTYKQLVAIHNTSRDRCLRKAKAVARKFKEFNDSDFFSIAHKSPYANLSYKQLVVLFKSEKDAYVKDAIRARAKVKFSEVFKNEDFFRDKRNKYFDKTYKELVEWHKKETNTKTKYAIRFYAKKKSQFKKSDFDVKVVFPRMKKSKWCKFSYLELIEIHKNEVNKNTRKAIRKHVSLWHKDVFKDSDFPKKDFAFRKRYLNKSYEELIQMNKEEKNNDKRSEIKKAAKFFWPKKFNDTNFTILSKTLSLKTNKELINLFLSEPNASRRAHIKNEALRRSQKNSVYRREKMKYNPEDFPSFTKIEIENMIFEKYFKPIVKNLITYQTLSPNLD